MFFKELEGTSAVIVSRGVYKQVPVFVRSGQLFAKTAGGFIRLRSDGSTSLAKCRLDALGYDGPLHVDRWGYLLTEAIPESKPVRLHDNGALPR